MRRTPEPPPRFDRELLKGNTATVVLAILAEGQLHGYQIAKEMRRRSDEAANSGRACSIRSCIAWRTAV